MKAPDNSRKAHDRRSSTPDDAYWIALAEVAVQRGEFLTPEETMLWINARLARAQ